LLRPGRGRGGADRKDGRAGHDDFSPTEKLAMTLMKTRRPRTRKPDNDRTAGGTAMLASISVF
jgi:hypothetical protein